MQTTNDQQTWVCVDRVHDHPTAIDARDCSIARVGKDEWRRRWARDHELAKVSAAARLQRGKA